MYLTFPCVLCAKHITLLCKVIFYFIDAELEALKIKYYVVR